MNVDRPTDAEPLGWEESSVFWIPDSFGPVFRVPADRHSEPSLPFYVLFLALFLSGHTRSLLYFKFC